MRRSKRISNPKGTPEHLLNPLVIQLRKAVEAARCFSVIERDPEAEKLWENIYAALWEGKPGMLGAIIARSEAQVMRLACIYAAMDCSKVVKSCHLKAASALWEYCAASAAYIFGARTGNADADEILRALRRGPAGMTRTAINNLFGRNKPAERIMAALTILERHRLARREERETEGRTAEVWVALVPQQS